MLMGALAVPAGCGQKTSRSVRNQTQCERLGSRRREMLNHVFAKFQIFLLLVFYPKFSTLKKKKVQKVSLAVHFQKVGLPFRY